MGYSSPASPESPAGPVSPEGPQTSPGGLVDETEVVTGADQLLSTAVSNGLSDPFDPAQGGWVAASLTVDPYSGLAAGKDGVDPFSGGLAIDPYAGAPAGNDNPNAYTGGQNVEPVSGDAAGTGSSTQAFGAQAHPILAFDVPAGTVDDPIMVYDGNGNVVGYQYVDDQGRTIYEPVDKYAGSEYIRFPDDPTTVSRPLDAAPKSSTQPPVTTPSASQTPTPAPTPPVSPATQPAPTPASATATPAPAQPPPTPPSPQPAATPAQPSTPASTPQTSPEQRDEENWSAAKAGMWDSLVNMVEGLANMGPQAAVSTMLPGVGLFLAPSLPHISFDWAKSGPPAPTGNPRRDAELRDNYRSGGWVTTTVSLALPFAAEGMLGSALSAAGKLPALEGMGMIGGGRLIGPTEQWLASFGETSEALGPEAADALAPETQASGPAAQSGDSFVNQNLQHVLRGGSGDRGIGVLHLDGWKLSPADAQAAIAAVRDMDFQAGMAGGLTRSSVPSRSIADSVTRLARGSEAMNLGGDAAGHLPDVAGGGSPYGPIMGLPRLVNSSIGGQWSRYAPGFTFDGFSLVDRSTGAFLYMSQGLEEEPALILDFH
jgi:hypothetical protein